MNKQAIMMWMLAGAVGLSVAAMSHAQAQSTLGGVKNPQNKIGGAAKPVPVLGGATLHAPSPPAPAKPGPAITTTKAGSPGAIGTTTSVTAPAAGNVRPNPLPVTPPNKGAAITNLKCAAGACTTRGVKP